MTTNFILQNLHNVTLAGQGSTRPVIKCAEKSLKLNVTNCTAVSINNLRINCPLITFTKTVTINISDVFAKVLHSIHPSVFSAIIISSSKFICSMYSTGCIHIYLHTGRLLLKDIVTSNRIDNGIVIKCVTASITVQNVSATNNYNNGIYLILYEHSRAFLNGINVSNNGNYGLYWNSATRSIVQLTHITANNCSYGLYSFIKNQNYINMSHIISSNNRNGGLAVQCMQHNEVILNNFDLVGNSKYGAGFYCVSDENQFHFNGGHIANSNGFALGLYCVGYYNCRLTMTNSTFINNSGSAIAAIGTWYINFSRLPSNISHNRSPHNGGGIISSGRVTFTSDTTVYFINNTAQGMGGAIYLHLDEVRRQIAEPAHYTFAYFAPIFVNNTAYIAGNNVYNGMYHTKHSYWFLDRVNCSSISYLPKFPRPFSSYITSIPLGVCICDNTSVVNCNKRSIDAVLYPGQSINLSLVTVGECGGISPSVLVISTTSGVEVVHADVNQETIKKCKTFTYTINQHDTITGKGNVQLGIKTTAVNIALKDSQMNMSIRFQQCPRGLHLVSGSCRCDSIIGDVNGTHCDINLMPHPISRSDNNWFYYSEEYKCVVAHNNCPFDYCNSSTVYLNLNESDLQCTNGRSGILCGSCQPGLSLVLGSNRCEHCSNKYISLVVAFILAGLMLVAFLLVTDSTVSVGSINGLLFYANVIKLNEAVLFPNGVSIPVLSQFIAWLNLDLGIQTCFFNGLDGYWKAWLQFIFPLYIWLLISAIIIGCYYSGRLARLCGNNAVPVLATLIFMSYTKLLRVITNILMLAVIRCKQTHWIVWSVDGNIDYLSGKHIPLFLVALLFILIGLVYTGLVFSAQWLQRYSGRCFKSSRDPVVKLKPFIDAYTGPYKDKYRYWTGLLLIVRLLLTTVFSYTTGTVPQINNYIIAVVTAVLLYLSRGVYRKRKINMLEAFYLINLGVMSQLNALSYSINLHIYSTITTVSITLSLAVFILTVILHILAGIKKRLGLNFCPTENSQNLLTLKESDLLANHTFAIREPLIFDF